MAAIPFPIPSPKEIKDYIEWLRSWVRKERYEGMVAKQLEGRNNPSLYRYLNWLYGYHDILKHGGLMFPAAIFPAPKEQRYSVESVLGVTKGGPKFESTDRIAQEFEEAGKDYVKKLEESTEKRWDSTTYRMTKFEFGQRLKVTCALGSYYDALKSCDMLELELLTKLGKKALQPEDYQAFTEKLVLRNVAHSKGNVFCEGAERSVAIAVSTLIIFIENGTFKALIRERSKKVAVHQNLVHVIPSAMFQPVVACYEDEYSVKHNIYREYLEEVLGRKDVERPQGEYAFDFFYEDPNLRYLKDLESRGGARFYFTGVAVNLLNLRPEICTLLTIKDPDWIVNQRRGRRVSGHRLSVIRINWEFKNADELRGAKFDRAALDLTDRLTMPENLFRPENFVPPGAAALKLGIEVAREELGVE